MNGKLLISLFAGLLLAGGAAWAQEVDCKPVETKDKKCQGDKHYPIVTINTRTKEIHPEFVCASRGSIIEFRVVPPGKTDRGSIDVAAKDSAIEWLFGANFPDNKKIEVRVSRQAEIGSIHEYNVYFEDDTCIDPRVNVED